MGIILWIVIAVIAFPIIVGPFFIKKSHWVSLNAVLMPTSPEFLNPSDKEFIEKARIEFEALGFEFVGCIRLAPDYMPSMSSCLGLFRNDRNMTMGVAYIIKHAAGKEIRYFELNNIYSNRCVINTTNASMMGAFKDSKRIHYRYPAITSIRRLQEINNWIISHDQRTGTLVGIEKGKEIDIIRESLEGELRQQAEYGYYFIDTANARYRPTWKGAFILTEKNVFPFKNILEFFDLRSAKQAIKGMPT
jgi:hypothetical protein